jgi:SRSO17 transposase
VTIIKENEMGGHVARMEEIRNAKKILVKSLKEGRPRHGWKDNIKTDIRDIGFAVWIGFIWLSIGTGDGLL